MGTGLKTVCKCPGHTELVGFPCACPSRPIALRQWSITNATAVGLTVIVLWYLWVDVLGMISFMGEMHPMLMEHRPGKT